MSKQPPSKSRIKAIKADLTAFQAAMAEPSLTQRRLLGKEAAIAELVEDAKFNCGGIRNAIEVIEAEIIPHLAEIYDYAMNGVLPVRSVTEWGDAWHYWHEGNMLLGDLYLLVSLPRATEESGAGETHVRPMAELHALLRARMTLDYCGWSNSEGFLTLEQLSMLAGMTLQSVRNAASRPGPNKLSTKRIGKMAYVSCADAITWLAKKDGFNATTQIEDQALIGAYVESWLDASFYIAQ